MVPTGSMLEQLERSWVSSTKIDKILEKLGEIFQNDSEKVIIFSQFTSFLDIVPLS